MFGRRIIYFLVLLELSFSLSLSEIKIIRSEDVNKGPCHCGIFESKEVTDQDKVLISKNYMNVTCNRNGTQLCFDLCTSLAKASKERATQALCQNLEHATNLIASLFTKACDGPWQYSGITADEPICCHDKKVVDCKRTTAGMTAGPIMAP